MRLECQNCGKIADEEKFPEAKHLSERHCPGDTFSDQECPDCGALAFPVETKSEKGKFDPRTGAVYENETYYKALEFCELIARMKTEEDFGEDQPEDDDWCITLCELIASARQITGIEGPDIEDDEPVTDDDRSNGPGKKGGEK